MRERAALRTILEAKVLAIVGSLSASLKALLTQVSTSAGY